MQLTWNTQDWLPASNGQFAAAATSHADSAIPDGFADQDVYKYIRKIGEGSMGAVFLVRNSQLERLEVMKVLRPHLAEHHGAFRRLVHEARLIKRLNHKNIITVYSTIKMSSLYCYTMEYVEGIDLGAVVSRGGPLPVSHAANYAWQAASALECISGHHIVHRDIKPRNLLLSRDGRQAIVKVLDFGLADSIWSEERDALNGQMVGTPGYLAPEQITNPEVLDARSDIFGLGCTLYFLLAGENPFGADRHRVSLKATLGHNPPPLYERRPEVPKRLSALVGRMMEKDASKRFQTAGEVVAALRRFAGDPPDYDSIHRDPKIALDHEGYKNVFELIFRPVHNQDVDRDTTSGLIGKLTDKPDKGKTLGQQQGSQVDRPEFLAELLAVGSKQAPLKEKARSLGRLSHAFRQRVAAELAPALNEHIQGMPSQTLEEKKEIARFVNEHLEPLGLAVKDPRTLRPGKLRGTANSRAEGGIFQIEVKIDGKQEYPTTSAALPTLELMNGDPPEEVRAGFLELVKKQGKSAQTGR